MRHGSPSILGLSDQAFGLLRDLIREKTGLHYDDDQRDILAQRISSLILAKGFESYLDYYYALKYGKDADAEWDRVRDALAVRETYFWREADQIEALVGAVVPRHFDAAPTRPLRIWSAACATGEEPLSIAMALDDSGWLRRAPIEIRASDASAEGIERARAGLFRERSFRVLSPRLKERYFKPEGESWRVAPNLLAAVRFEAANLVDEASIRSLAESEVIFCRNVFIYFTRRTIADVASTFWRRMPSPAYLFIGASESLIGLDIPFRLDELKGAFVYVKS